MLRRLTEEDFDRICPKKPFQKIKCEDTDCIIGDPKACVRIFIGGEPFDIQ
ncbi:MAG: hypothetical protein A4E28_00017 [Methanocella sp. PtaU1.Bin125]|nr:MAG: hypothetical protein A4E28_00017 [Methanocella sp. PtaU1.Bin125]